MSRRPKENISKECIELIKSEVTKRFGREIKNTPDCVNLSDSIYSYTGQLISYNTLRRFFGLIKNNTIINKTSLDILASYCGLSCFELLVNRKDKLDINELNYYFINILNKNNINIKEIELFCKEYGVYPQIYSFLEKCLLFSQTNNDISFFKSFYTLPVIFDYAPNKRKYIFDIAQLYANIIKSFSEDTKKEIISKIASLPKARQFYFEIFVDVDNITGFYSFVLEEYHKYSKLVSSLLFYYNLKVYKSFLIKDTELLKTSYDELKKLKFNEREVFPILPGRILASDIYYHKNFGSINKKDILSKAEKQLKIYGTKDNQALLASQLYLIYIFQALQFCNEIDILSDLIKNINPAIFNISDYLTDNATNHLKIYHAHYFIYINEIRKAENVIDTISPKCFPLFEKITQTISYNFMLKDYYQELGKQNMVCSIEENIKNYSKIKGFKAFEE
ncbi:MAG: hypothetical protein KAT68_11175 [Bacteroidales bacterium]|nr:hypothetical protein [Bacteroidales bacterium]